MNPIQHPLLIALAWALMLPSPSKGNKASVLLTFPLPPPSTTPAWMSEWMSDLAKSHSKMEFGEAHSLFTGSQGYWEKSASGSTKFSDLATESKKTDSPSLAKPWTLDFLLNMNVRKLCWLFCKGNSKDADVHFCALFHFLLYTFTLSFTAGMHNPASPVLRTKNTEASFCLRAPSPCQDCDRHFSGPPNKKAPAFTLQLKE